jgi:imidazole glycerol phosphate synthase subunit HisF
VLCASILHDGVYSVTEVKAHLAQAGVDVRGVR